MKFDPKHLMILAEIYESGGFSDAALSLGTSQPSLSRIVKSLEDRIGQSLFSRTRKPLKLTPIGESLVDQGRAIRTAAKRASESVDRIRSGDEGELRVGSTPFFLDGFVSGLIAEYQATRPNITIRLSHGYSSELISEILGDRLDIALCPIDFLDPKLELNFLPLIKGRNVIACRVGHPLRSQKNLSLNHLLDFPWIAPPPLSPLNADLKNVLVSTNVTYINIIASGGGLGTVVNYLANSDCLTILPHTVVFALRRKGSLSALPVEINHPNRTLGLLTSNRGDLLPLVESLTTHLQNRIAEMLHQIQRHEAKVMKSE
ncbi:MAG: LysR family transcriptional regulator [Paracoccaceae bacterium]